MTPVGSSVTPVLLLLQVLMSWATSPAAAAAEVHTHNALEHPSCQRLDDVDSLEEAIDQLRERWGHEAVLLAPPGRLPRSGRWAALIELPAPTGRQLYLLVEGSLVDCETAFDPPRPRWHVRAPTPINTTVLDADARTPAADLGLFIGRKGDLS